MCCVARSIRRCGYEKYAAYLMIVHAAHLRIFEQPA
jgi:hypothetical protein